MKLAIPRFSRHWAALLLPFLLAACSHVEPWERGTLAREDMAITPDPEQAKLRTHVYVSKEASSGGHQGSGGGCGCN